LNGEETRPIKRFDSHAPPIYRKAIVNFSMRAIFRNGDDHSKISVTVILCPLEIFDALVVAWQMHPPFLRLCSRDFIICAGSAIDKVLPEDKDDGSPIVTAARPDRPAIP
jgi:hypothetical protein